MKNINYVINGVLAVAVVILFIMQFFRQERINSNKKHLHPEKVIQQTCFL